MTTGIDRVKCFTSTETPAQREVLDRETGMVWCEDIENTNKKPPSTGRTQTTSYSTSPRFRCFLLRGIIWIPVRSFSFGHGAHLVR